MSSESSCGTAVRIREIVNVRHGLIAAALFALGAWSGIGFAQSTSPASRFAEVPDSPAQVTATSRPARAAPDGRVRVVVVMSADSVASVRARMPLHTMAQAQSVAIQRQAQDQQAAIKPMLAQHGAKVLAQYQHALNGIKVEVDSSKIATLAKLPGVVGVYPVGVYERVNATSVPFIGAPQVWQGIPGFRGEGIKVAVIDTGIDYTHANFGGPGTVAAYNAAFATDTLPADPSMFGPGAPKVKGGTDLVGDTYYPNPTLPSGLPNPDYQPVPIPDPNPLDCPASSGSVGHGSHVAGTAVGFGVLSGATYTGPYNSAAYSQHFDIGPGVAPKADLYSVRVFGCNGSTDVVTEAIDWVVAHNMDVVNLSLGSSFGPPNTSDAIAAHNAVLAGITVVISSGNSGPAPYITGSPASGTGAIVAAAMDGTAGFPGATIALNTGTNISAINANAAPLPSGSFPLVVLKNPDGSISLGCDESEWAAVAGMIVVSLRGNCDRVQRAKFGQAHGAVAAVMINNGAGLPPYEGTIPGVTIPFLGTLSTTGPAFLAASSATLSSAGIIPNPGFETVASFSSGGPRFTDSYYQPSLSAPGVSIFSTASGTGNAGQFLSGTSMAAPHITGVAALVRQAHPGWSEMAQRAAITQTADRFQMVGYSSRLAGNGVVQPLPATQTHAVVLGTTSAPEPLSLGFTEQTTLNYAVLKTIDVHNNGASPVQFKVKITQAGGVPHTVAATTSAFSVPPGGDFNLPIKVVVPTATIGSSHPLGTVNGFKDLAGTVTLTPADPSQNGGASLNVPYYLVPRARSLISVSHNVPSLANPSTTLTVSNGAATIAGTADFYAWGLSSAPTGLPYCDTRAMGVQSLPGGASAADRLLVFAVNTHQRVSTASGCVWEIDLDTNFFVLGIDGAFLSASLPAGRMVVAACNGATGACTVRFFADAPTDASTVLLPVRASDLGVTSAGHPRFTYVGFAEDLYGDFAQVGTSAKFNPFTPALSNGQFASVAPNGSTTVPMSINTAEWALTPALGVMAVAIENLNSTPQADLIPVGP